MEILADMKAIMHQIGIRQQLSNRRGKGFPQINRDRFDLRALLSVQQFQHQFGRISGSMFDGSSHNLVERVPVQSQHPGSGCDVGAVPQQLDGKAFEQQRET
jgi:hypothetical protein